MDNIKFNSISGMEFIILILVIFAIFFILYLEPKLGKKKIENKNEHGSSKFADKKEIEKTFVKEELNNINSVGFPVWYEKKNGKFESVYFDNKSPHYLLIGSTGSGKSVTVVIPECFLFATAKEKHSVVVTDPKAEIFNATSKVFKDNGYDVITIDFRNPNKSNKINIMQPIISEWKEYCLYNKIMLFLFAHFIYTLCSILYRALQKILQRIYILVILIYFMTLFISSNKAILLEYSEFLSSLINSFVNLFPSLSLEIAST